jgi:transforming growth factor-beta-induced protein
MRKTLLVALMALASPAAFAQTTDSTTAPVAPMPAPAPEVVEPPAPTQSVAELIAADTSLSLFKQALEQANLFGALGQAYEAGYTVLAPTNAAFRKLSNLEGLLGPAQTQILYTTLMYHVVPGKYLAVHFPQLQSVKSWQGSDIAIMMMGETAMLGSGHLVGTEMPATNGVIHLIDTVLTVPAGGSNP